ncbi:MAG: hypothetical protein PVJ72_01895 [Gammaproteobacteria bacterium]|jgi:hypothetical protein
MLQVDGIQPKLEGHVCEALICQQYWYNGKLDDEVDVLFLKADGRCHQLYFENGVVFWRMQKEVPQPFEQKPGDKFAYPFIDLGEKYQLNHRLITAVNVEPLPEGVKIGIAFENGGELILYHLENRTEIRRITG